MIWLNLLLRVTGKKKSNGINTPTTYSKTGSSFDFKAASLYSISIHLDKEFISFGYSDPNTGEILALEQLEYHIKKDMNWVEFITTQTRIKSNIKNAQKTSIYPITKSFTLIPTVFFDKENYTELASSVIECAPNEQFHYTWIPEIDHYLVFPFDHDALTAYQGHFGPLTIRHHFASLISNYSLYYAREEQDQVFVHFHDKVFTVCVFQGKTMKHFNCFDWMSYEDVVYYTYYTMNQLELDVANTPIHLGGYFPSVQETITALQRYSAHVFEIQPREEDSFSTEQSTKLLATIFDIQCG